MYILRERERKKNVENNPLCKITKNNNFFFENEKTHHVVHNILWGFSYRNDGKRREKERR